jgi:EAL domain-containing protein (putative c-di-GMP-specific phosphodiesterase class I)
LARFGGDEFALLLVESGPEQGEAVAQAMVTVVREHPFILAGRNVRVTVSIGVAVIDPKCKDDIFSAADFAMYDAKRAGRDRHATFNPAVDRTQQVSSQMNEAAHVKAAINEGRFVLYCQPIRDLATNTITQHEILLRLREDELAEPLRPAAFLYIAERYGLIQSLDIMVIRQAVELVKRAQKLGRELVLSINLSGKSLGDPTLAMTIEDLITSSRVNPKNLIFELTETAAITNLDQARDFGEMLHNLGCQLALDDFGAGFASFYYLKNLPLDYVKIDGEFIRRLMDNPTDLLVVKAIVAIAKGMGKRTIAEFVGDQATTDALAEVGVDYAQGYFIGQPVPVGKAFGPEFA